MSFTGNEIETKEAFSNSSEAGTAFHKKVEAGLRFNNGKLKWSLMDFDAFEPMIKVLEFGAQKYSSHNWKKGLKVTEILESLQRHMNALLRGEENDPESGLPHSGHIQCNAMFLAYMLKFKPDMDDRFKDENKIGETKKEWEWTIPKKD